MGQSDDKKHAEFCECQFALNLFRLIRLWKAAGKPVKR